MTTPTYYASPQVTTFSVMTMTQQTDRELIQHLVNELQGYRVAHPDHEMPALEAGRTRLAQPEPEGATDEAWQEFIEQVQHAQHVASREGEGPRFDLVECALALWREAIPPAPEPEGLTDEQWDAIRERLWDNYETVGYQGERFMYQGDFDTALDVARKDLARYARPAIKPVPATEPVPVEDCDGDGNCWWFCPAAILPNGQCAYWCLAPADGARSWFTHWLPARAMPLPQQPS